MPKPPYLPPWSPPDALAAVDDVLAYAATLTRTELVGSLWCVVNDATISALRIGLANRELSGRLRQHAAMSNLVAKVLLDRLEEIDHTTPTHEHCQGFFAVVASAETRIVDAGTTP